MAGNNEARQRAGWGGRLARLTYYSSPGVYRNMSKKVVTPFRLALVGVLCCATRFTWMLVWHYTVHRPETAMMDVYYIVPLFPRVVFLSGILLLLASGVWKLVPNFIGR